MLSSAPALVSLGPLYLCAVLVCSALVSRSSAGLPPPSSWLLYCEQLKDRPASLDPVMAAGRGTPVLENLVVGVGEDLGWCWFVSFPMNRTRECSEKSLRRACLDHWVMTWWPQGSQHGVQHGRIRAGNVDNRLMWNLQGRSLPSLWQWTAGTNAGSDPAPWRSENPSRPHSRVEREVALG